ncbi:MAG: lipoate--protein ligase family protein [Rhodococcus sp. (in: high G+C Gram-positive bacteria)]|uniref:lipoate--protein ligase family protein n=1 Tax=Rhodococcus sp. TaxID=1831 RepID=UPI00120ACF00|nr:biotin/lipoate A/B protein ligase family protein [Rhodococcus sp. (in: high G+C Gram-positive bacteria)]RZL24984.1 MAG: lipoate--protein ligase family protein [Rhodococcus sp. (in: high G+C Gram-positive bacteria)]
MRGEYKVPGGKLVAVDVEVEDGQLSDVAVSGDFFLEPDSALDDINGALTGMPADANVEQLADAIIATLDESVSMIGFTAESVGIAIRRALGHATSWADHIFDVISPAVLDPAMHVALDEVIAREVASGERPATLRFWDWDSPLVVIGSFQSVRNEVDSEAAARHGIGVVRRISGGGAMFMEPGNCITYSLVVPASLVEGLSFERSYAFLDQWVMGALAEVGITARYVPLNDIASDKGKIAGAAQKRFADGTVVHHVTMAYDIDAEKMTQVLRIGREKMSDKGTKSAAKRVDPLRSQTGMTRAAILTAFENYFRSQHDTRTSTYTEAELAQARELVETKFSTEKWTHRVP